MAGFDGMTVPTTRAHPPAGDGGEMSDNDRMSNTDLLVLDFDGKVKLLQRVAGEMLDMQLEYARISGRHAELRAQLEVLKQVKSALQSAIKAEMQ